MTELWMLFAEYRISMTFLLVFQLLFLPLRYKKRKSAVIVSGCFLLSGVMEYFIFFIDLGWWIEFSLTIFEIFLVQSTAYILSCYKDCRTLFTGISSATYVLIGNVFYIGMTTFFGSHIWILILATLIHTLILLVLVMYLRQYYLNEMENYSAIWKRLCVIPALFYTVVYTLMIWPASMFETKENWLSILLILVLMEATYGIMIKIISQEHIEHDMEKNKDFLEIYASGLRREMNILKKSEEKIRLLSHDSRHIYQIMCIYMKEEKYDELQDMLEQLNKEYQSVTPIIKYCDNLVINGILSGFSEKCEKENVKFICNVDIPEKFKSINEFELATVISNLLENAVQAAKNIEEKKERKVMIRMFPVKGQIMMEIKNTFSGICERSDITGLPVSVKGKEHGYGLRSVKAYANKNRAIFRYSVEGDLFCVRLLTNI